MSPTTPTPGVTILRIAAGLAALALLASGLVAMLMEMGVLAASPTRYAVLGIFALAFTNWLVRLLLELGTHARTHGGGGSRPTHGFSVYDWFRQRQRRQRRAV